MTKEICEELMIYDVQKASLLKRFSAFLLDFILLCVLTTGFAFLLAWITGIDGYTKTFTEYYNQFEEQHYEEFEKEYGVDFDISQEDYDKLTQEQKDRFAEARQALEKLWEAELKDHPEVIKAYRMSTALPMLITTISLLLSYLVFEFIIPLCLKNGQTVGKKIFSLGVVFNNSVRINNFALFVRAIFGKYTIETMFPVMLIMLAIYQKMNFILALVLVAALFILQLVLLIATKTKSLVHDTLANTVVVDLQSQMIFDTTQDLISYKEELSKQESEKKEY